MLVDLNQVTKVYRQGGIDVYALKDISFQADRGDYIAIMGPSGSGKTTLMNILGCLDRQTGGNYRLCGENVQACKEEKLSELRLKRIGFVFQNFYLQPELTAEENVALPLIYAGIKKKERMERAREILGRVGLADRMNFKPFQLSGGQCQRIAIARAMVNHPDLLLADEPTGALDTASGEQVMDLFSALNLDGVTIIMITHEASIAARAKKILHIKDGRFVDTVQV